MYEQEISIEILNNRMYLDSNCWSCSLEKPTEGCEYCKGTGFIPTVMGNEILAFLYRHSNLKEKEIL